MTPEVSALLGGFTADFYRKHALSFDASRSGSWDSWPQVIQAVTPAPTSILDLGCGNGRFAGFLLENEIDCTNYLGVDSEPELIAAAQRHHPDLQFQVQNLDAALDSINQFDLIVMFGVMHHIAGIDTRRQLIRRLADRLTPTGSLALSLWQPRLLHNFERKLCPSPDERVHTNDLETNDYLLGWQGSCEAVRYCHHFDDTEIEDLAQVGQFRITKQFQGSGNDASNRYVVFNDI